MQNIKNTEFKNTAQKHKTNIKKLVHTLYLTITQYFCYTYTITNNYPIQ